MAQRIVDLIKQDLASFQGTCLPPITELCDTYQVSRTTLVSAFAILKKEGLIKAHCGRRTEIVGRKTALAQVPRSASAVELSKNFIAKEIAAGTFRAGEYLPKSSTLCAKLGIGVHTIAKAMKELVQVNLVHRQGRTYVVGPKLVRNYSPPSFAPPPIIIVLSTHQNHWDGMRASSRHRPFAESFLAEASRNSVRIISVMASPEQSHRYGIVLPAGKEGLKQVIKESQGRYLGTLIIEGSSNFSEMNSCLELLHQIGRPIVWFDRLDEPNDTRPKTALFTRCHHNERAMASVALKFLQVRGHKKVLYVYIGPDWQQRRKQMLNEENLKLDFPLQLSTSCWTDLAMWKKDRRSQLNNQLKIVCSKISAIQNDFKTLEQLWPLHGKQYRNVISKKDTPTGDFSAFISYILAHRFLGAPKHPLLDELCNRINTAMELAPLFDVNPATAIIAPRDLYAQTLFSWCRAVNLQIPSAFSMISFDNEFSSSYFPLTTVDPGFAKLGYQAFHKILGDVPVLGGRQGNIPAQPMIMDNGSVILSH